MLDLIRTRLDLIRTRLDLIRRKLYYIGTVGEREGGAWGGGIEQACHPIHAFALGRPGPGLGGGGVSPGVYVDSRLHCNFS
jgi:hypothetical protein